ncbi:hypothetical protein ACWCOP_13210 [Maricaulaceae bacterium MS644]
MILDNLTRAFKTQNWLAVATEFVIVIAGVVIGFQINAWNEGRQERAEEARVIERIRTDFERIRMDANRSLVFHQTLASDLTTLVRALRAGELSDDEVPVVRRALFLGPTFQTSGDRSGTFTELLSSGRANILSDKDLLNALVAYEDFLDRFGEAHDYYVAQALGFQQPFSAAFEYDLGAPFFPNSLEFGEVVPPIGAFDFEEMAGDEAFINAAEQLVFVQTLYSMWRLRISARIEAIQGQLEREAP